VVDVDRGVGQVRVFPASPSDGRVAPAETPAHVTLTGDSAGATASLATLADGSKSVSIGWPTKLPEPVLDGDTALYANVLPDVDLKIRANAAGRYFKRTRSFIRNGRR
jgi:hypothetical protein